MGARQRVSHQDAAQGGVAERERIVAQMREVWPEVKIMLRGDGGFCRDQLLSCCEANGVDGVLGLARNERLRSLIEEAMQQAAQRQQQTGEPARVFREFDDRRRQSWSRARRVVAQAEQLPGQENRRYLVTSLDADRWPAQPLSARRDPGPQATWEAHADGRSGLAGSDGNHGSRGTLRDVSRGGILFHFPEVGALTA